MQESLISQGLDLMLFGMGSVLLFLAVLVVVTSAMSAFITRFLPDPSDTEPPSGPQPATPVVDSHTLEIIQAAIDQHRSKPR